MTFPLALHSCYNEIRPSKLALADLPSQVQSSSLEPPDSHSPSFLACLSSVCSSSAWNAPSPEFLWSSPAYHSSLRSNVSSSEKLTLISMRKAAPYQLLYIPLSCYIFSWHLLLFYNSNFTHYVCLPLPSPQLEQNKEPQNRYSVLFTTS